MASSSSSVMSVLIDPEYIQFLLDPELEFSCYFVVGNPDLAPVEKIGVVRKMLAAHSEVFRTQLLNRQGKFKEPENVTDILPVTFKNLLRFVYGYDTTADMSFNDADLLLYAADRYIMKRLKNRLATRLMELLDYTNICSLLTNPACSKLLELQSEMNKIIWSQTDKILALPQFLDCSQETFVKILEQEVLNVPELEVWRAAVTWAEDKVKTHGKKPLRLYLDKPLRHIRVCTMSADEFLSEVVPSGILSNDEIVIVGLAIGTKKQPKYLTSVSNNIEKRRKPASSNTRSGGNQGVVKPVKSTDSMEARKSTASSNNNTEDRHKPVVEPVKSADSMEVRESTASSNNNTEDRNTPVVEPVKSANSMEVRETTASSFNNIENRNKADVESVTSGEPCAVKMEVKKATVERFNRTFKYVRSAEELCASLVISRANYADGYAVEESSFSLQNLNTAVELTGMYCFVYQHHCMYTLVVKIAPVGASPSSVTTITRQGHHESWEQDFISLSTDEKPVILLPQTKYDITVSCTDGTNDFKLFRRPDNDRVDHFQLEFRGGSPTHSIMYRTLTPVAVDK